MMCSITVHLQTRLSGIACRTCSFNRGSGRAMLRDLSDLWAEKIRTATEARILFSQSGHYIGHGQHKALAPSMWRPAAGASRWDRRSGT
jgi:hypothetical protein